MRNARARVNFAPAETRNVVTFEAARFTVDKEARTLSGVLLPFGEVSSPASDGNRYSFTAETLEVPDAAAVPVVLNYGHDQHTLNMQVGIASSLAGESDGVHARFKVARTPEGDRILALAEDKILRSFSAEVDGEFELDNDTGVYHATRSTLTGAAVVPRGAFAGATITSVAASAARTEGNNNMKCDKCGVVHAAGVTECDPAQVATFAAGKAAPDFARLEGQVSELAKKVDGLAEIKTPVTGTAQLAVKEEPIYRFAGSTPAPSGFDFATDLLAAGRDGDAAALARIKKFTAQALAPQFVDTSDAAAVNPSSYRADMFLGQAPVPPSPLYDFFFKGSLDSVTPFFWSKLDRANTTVDVHDHTEGTDPTDDDLATVAGATVTPVPVSGKVHITREVSDQGGNPQVSGLVWSEFDRSMRIALESKTSALVLAGLGGVTAIATIPTGTSGVDAGLAVEGGLVDLQFDPEGYRFARAFGHRDLYKALATATNSEDEKIYPIKAPTNRDGQAAEKFSSLEIAGYNMYPAASLGAAGGTKNSLLADAAAVWIWNSGLHRLDKLTETVEGWDMGVFGYFAGVLYDTNGLRKITYTP